MKKFFNEFRDFINRGNAMDMAVGVIIGGAFTAIVTSLTTDILNPFIKLVTGGGDASLSGLVIAGIDFSAFISAVINFLIVAFVVFCLVKGLNSLQNVEKRLLGNGAEAEALAPPTCPHCLEEVKGGATRCPHCAGEIAVLQSAN